MTFFPDCAPNSRKEWGLSLFNQFCENELENYRNFWKFWKFGKLFNFIQFYSILFNRVLIPAPSPLPAPDAHPAPAEEEREDGAAEEVHGPHLHDPGRLEEVAPKLTGSIGEGSNDLNVSHQSSVKILSRFCQNSVHSAKKFKKIRIMFSKCSKNFVKFR